MSAPTLIIGVGGVGSDIVGRVIDKLGDDQSNNVAFVIFDTDANDLGQRKKRYPQLGTVHMSPSMTVQECLSTYEGWEKWFPAHPVLQPKDLTQGAGQVRAISRLAFETVITDNKIAPLQNAIKSLHGISGDDMAQSVRVIICSCISGGTGSGLVLPLGLYLRNYLKNVFHKNSIIIRGHFVLPDVLTSTVIRNDARQKRYLDANAFATIREIDAFMRKGDGFDQSEDYPAVTFDVPVAGSNAREEYPPLLPYDFVFMYDAQNFDGKVLADKDTYFDYVAQCIYSQALTPVGLRNNSAEDNMIRETVHQEGRSRYCGVGTSRIVYPIDDVRDYVAFGWALKNVADEWLSIDDAFARACRDAESRGEDSPDEGEFYINTVNQGAEGQGNRFLSFIRKQSQSEIKSGDGQVYSKDLAEQYVSAVEKNVSSRASGDVRFKSAKSTCEDSRVENFSQETSRIQRACNRYREAVLQFKSATDEILRQLPYSVASALYCVPEEYDFNSYSKNEFDIAHWMKDSKGNALHPSAARYVLYGAVKRLQNKKQACDSRLPGLQRIIDEFVDDREFSTNVRKAAANSASDSSKKRFGKSDDEPAPGSASFTDLAGSVDDVYEAIERFYTLKMQSVVYERGISFLKDLLKSYALFYGQIRTQVDELRARRFEIEQSKLYNATSDDKNKILASAVRYVCADSKCLRAIERQAFIPSSSTRLPNDICQSIFVKALQFSEIKRVRESIFMDEDLAASKATEYFKNLFDTAIVDYWRGQLDNGVSSQLVNMDVIDAMRKEAEYRFDIDQLDEQDEYAEKIFAEGKVLAKPMLENPHGVQPRPINSCLYSSRLGKTSTSKYSFCQRVLNTFSGITDDSFPMTEILLFESVYGLCANQIPKFTPTGSLQEGVEGGNYFKAYDELITRLGPISGKNRELTPHLDVRWHQPFSFPNIDDAEETRQKNNVVRAFIHGLVFGLIKVRSARPRNVYELRLDGTHDFVTGNGTECDCFYEIFDALNVNPPFVHSLVERSDQSLRDERMMGNRSIADCELVKHLGCTAFGSSSVVEPFIVSEFGDERRSILEIPLLYMISSPANEMSYARCEEIMDGVFATIQNYFHNIVDDDEFDLVLYTLLDEQYDLFEANIYKLDERGYKGIARNRLVSMTRTKLLELFDSESKLYEGQLDALIGKTEKNERYWTDELKRRDDEASKKFLIGGESLSH